MLFKPTIAGEMSGSLGAIVASHNRGGQYLRVGVIPTNPGTVEQTLIRSLMSVLTSRWTEVLTQAQRDAWDVYAVNVPITGPLGEPRNIGGIAQFIRSNVARLQTAAADLGQIDDAPTIFNLGSGTLPTVVAVDAAADTIDIGFNNGDAWAIAVGGGLTVLVSRPQNPSINFFKGPYRLAGFVLGAIIPPTSPATLTLPFPVGVGNVVFVQFRFTQVDGRLSSVLRGFEVAA